MAAVPVTQRYCFLDISVEALTRPDLDAMLAKAIDREERLLIGNHNLHSLYLFHQSAAMRAFYAAADHVHVDGISIVWLARLFGVPLACRHRTGYMDWLPTMMESAQQRGWRVFYLGSRPGVLEQGLGKLRCAWPGLQIEGRHGYFDKAMRSLDNLDVLTEIAEYKPDLLMVGMGMPVQEEWIVENLSHLPISAVVACGALMDYVAGAVATPPRWLGPLGLEWLFRLAAEPRRLSRRYLVEPWTVLHLVWKNLRKRGGEEASVCLSAEARGSAAYREGPDMKDEQSVAVVITTRQRPDLLPRAIKSAQQQTHAAKEIIVVVDGADAATEACLRAFADPRMKIVLLERQAGGSEARNIGVRAATSRWIAFLDDDDAWRPEKLETQLRTAFLSAAQYPVVACRVAATTPDGRSFAWPKRQLEAGEHLSDYLLARDRWTQGEGLITTSMILAPRELLMRVPFKTGLRRHQEWDWLLRATASAEVEILIAWEVLATWYIEGQRPSVSRMDQWKASFEWIQSMKRLVTPEAYASFLMVFVSAIAARERDRSAWRVILSEARRNGTPRAIDYTLMAAMWLLPQATRRRLRDAFVPQVQTV